MNNDLVHHCCALGIWGNKKKKKKNFNFNFLIVATIK